MTQLHDACERGDVEEVTYLLSNEECGINARNIDGESPLHIACGCGHLEAVKVLLKFQKCDINIQNSYGNTPLHIACHRSSFDIIKFLLEMRCSTNIVNYEGETAQDIIISGDGDFLLHIACWWDDVDVVKYLIIDERCNPNVQNIYLEDTPLHIACYKKSLNMIRLLLDRRCNTNIPNVSSVTAQNIPLNDDGDYLLHIACKWGDVDIVRYLIINERCNPNVQNIYLLNTPLHIACHMKSLSIIRLLLESRCSTDIPNKKGETAQDIPLNEDGDGLLHIACRWDDVNIVQYLITNERCDPNFRSSTSKNTPLHIAAKYGQNDTIIQLLSYKGCNSNAQNCKWDTPLHIACCKKSLNIIKSLLQMRCDTTIPNKKGVTAQDIPLNGDGDYLLHIACKWGDVNIVRYLITNERCDPNVQSSTSINTPLHIAAKYGQNDIIVQLLSNKECKPSAQNKEGDTPLHFAAKYGQEDIIVQLLLDKECDPNAQNNEGDTPLHFAAKYGQDDTIVKLLSYKECDPDIQNREGDAPLHFAVRHNKTVAISQLLDHHQSNPNAQNKEGNTPLHIACCLRLLRIIMLLLDRKCSTNIPNKKGATAQDMPFNDDGDYLLHIACQQGDVGIIRYLITDERCDPNVQSSTSKNTPLHIAAKYGQNDIIVQLLSNKDCKPSAQNKEGDTPLHFAAKYRQEDIIVQLLLHKECDPNAQNNEGGTPLHFAAEYGKDDIIVQLLLYKKCDPNVLNKDGDTPLHVAVRKNTTPAISQLLSNKQCNPNVLNKDGDTPLHVAVRKSTTPTISQLLSNKQCNPNVQNNDGDTPLHIAVRKNITPTISQLLSNKQCNPNILNKDGDTPLHVAARKNITPAISQLLSNKQCNPNVLNKDGDTPLHVAVRKNVTPAIPQLLSNKQCNPNVQNKDGDTPLHIAVRDNITPVISRLLQYNPKVQNNVSSTLQHIAAMKNTLPAISKLLANKQCNPNVVNNDHLTPLLIAVQHNNSSLATALLQYDKCDPTLRDQHGNTPLHLACIGSETQPEMVEVAKQLLMSVDPSCVNNAGQTPIELTTSYQLIQAISDIVKCKTKQSVQTYINMFIVGNPETGKSTLVKAICKEANILWKIVPKWMRRVKNVPLRTAGIIPTTFRSKAFGNTILYDLAGHVEYYTSHAAVIQSTVISTPPVFIVIINLSESEEKISQTLRYWWSFIDNHAARSSAPPQVILVGSHADIVKSTGGNVQEKMTGISALLKKLPASFHFAGQVALDCRDPASRKLQHFCSLVNQSCTVLRQKADVDLRCHVLYAFLLDRFKDKVACTVSDVATSIKQTSTLLPQKLDTLIPLISTLSDKGLLLLVKGGERCRGWWIILQKQALLGEMNGVIFAPKGFSQHKDLSWSTGVVPFFKLKKEFPDYNPNMVSEFLTHLEFCFKIEDHQTLALLKDEATNMEDTCPDVSEEYYFFPALVNIENPLHVWEQNDRMCCKCGWFYQCIRPDQFLTTQFLHVLILRLAFTFALKLDPGDCCKDSLTLRRKCSVWKHGIAWLDGAPIETVVEVGLQLQSIVVIMRCPEGKEAKCAQLRSEVVQKVLEAKDEHCKAVQMSESLVHPTDAKYPFTDNIEDVKFYSLTAIARSTVSEEEALDHRGRNPIPVQDLLLFHPYSSDTSTELLSELFGRKHSMDEKMRRQILETLNSEYSVTI